MITLTTPDGEKIHVNEKNIDMIKLNRGLFDSRAKTVLVLSGNIQAVQETEEEIGKLIGGVSTGT